MCGHSHSRVHSRIASPSLRWKWANGLYRIAFQSCKWALLHSSTLHYTAWHHATLHYPVICLTLIRVQIKQTEQNKRGKKDMIIAPSGNKDCGIRMFGILVWIWKLFSHPLFKRPYSLTLCWAWVVTKLNKIQKKKTLCVWSCTIPHSHN